MLLLLAHTLHFSYIIIYSYLFGIMKFKDEDPDNLGGLGDLLPAEVLKKLNELLERTHQADCKQHGSIVFNIYEKGSLHVDHVDNQNIYGDTYPKPKKTLTAEDPSATKTFDQDTPLSALFRENFHEDLRTVIESWRPYMIGDDPATDALAITRFEFDFSKILAMGVFIDLGHLLCKHPLVDDNMRTLADYLFLHSNLSNSQPTLYAQLRKYMKK